MGKIKHIYPDNDLKIEVCDTTWTYNPLCVTKISSEVLPLHQLSSTLNKINSTDLNEGMHICKLIFKNNLSKIFLKT